LNICGFHATIRAKKRKDNAMFKNVKIETNMGIATLTVNRPDALNALNNEVLNDLYDAFTLLGKDESVDAIIVTGEGKAFVAGADISAMYEMNPVQGRDMIANGHRVMNLIEATPKPVIAAVNGFALGGGCELAMACDIRIASERAKFGQPEVNLGIIPGFGGTQRLPRLVGKGMAKLLIMTGEIIDAQEAHRIGLVEKVVAPEHLMEAAHALANKIIAKAPLAISSAKSTINMGYNMDMAAASTLEIEAFTGPFSSQDKTEGMGAFLEKRQPKFTKK
jgi:enoyl-CoA hydratase